MKEILPIEALDDHPELLPKYRRTASHACPYCCPKHNDDPDQKLSDVDFYVIDQERNAEGLASMILFVLSTESCPELDIFGVSDISIQGACKCHCRACNNWFFAGYGVDANDRLTRYLIGFKDISDEPLSSPPSTESNNELDESKPSPSPKM